MPTKSTTKPEDSMYQLLRDLMSVSLQEERRMKARKRRLKAVIKAVNKRA